MYDVCEFVVQFLNLPGWLASEQGGVGSGGVKVLHPQIRNPGCLLEEVTGALPLLPRSRADAGPTVCWEQMSPLWAGHSGSSHRARPSFLSLLLS